MDNSKEWHWFKGGILVSLLSVATYFIFAAIADRNYPFGITAGFGYIAAQFGNLFGGLSENPVIKRFSEKPDAFIEFFLIIGLMIGGYTASKSSKTFAPENIPAVWEKYHGKSLVKRYVFVLIGSVLLGYGAALASGMYNRKYPAGLGSSFSWQYRSRYFIFCCWNSHCKNSLSKNWRQQWQ